MPCLTQIALFLLPAWLAACQEVSFVSIPGLLTQVTPARTATTDVSYETSTSSEAYFYTKSSSAAESYFHTKSSSATESYFYTTSSSATESYFYTTSSSATEPFFQTTSAVYSIQTTTLDEDQGATPSPIFETLSAAPGYAETTSTQADLQPTPTDAEDGCDAEPTDGGEPGHSIPASVYPVSMSAPQGVAPTMVSSSSRGAHHWRPTSVGPIPTLSRVHRRPHQHSRSLEPVTTTGPVPIPSEIVDVTDAGRGYRGQH
jgi:hypothetical protein